MNIPTGKNNEYNDRIERDSALGTASGSAERLHDVIYQTPSGKIHEFGMVSDFDALRRQEIKNDPEKRKGSWFASNRPGVAGSYFRI